MIIKEILFGKGNETFSLGRNGTLTTIGYTIQEDNRDVHILPITSKGEIARCRVSIPKEKWIGVALEAILQRDELLHLLLGIHPLLDELLAPRLKYPKSDWEYEVKNKDTKLGYEEWLEHKVEAE